MSWGHIIELHEDTNIESAKSWCREYFGVENPNVWSTLEPGWSIQYNRAKFQKHDHAVVFRLSWT